MGDVVSRLRFIPNEEVSQKSLIKFNKVQSAIRKEILNGRNHKCYYCGKEGVGFCNSHTIPAFCLKYISHNGKLGYINTIINSDIQKTHASPYKVDKIFWLICSGRFYLETPEINIGRHKAPFIEFAQQRINEELTV